jgi:hypothetical protein
VPAVKTGAERTTTGVIGVATTIACIGSAKPALRDETR